MFHTIFPLRCLLPVEVDKSSRRTSDYGLRTSDLGLRTSESARSRSGSALVIVLGMLSVLLLMGVAFSVTMRTERAGAANMRHAAIARHILDSALVRTMAELDRALEEQGDFPVPTGGVIVTVSQQPGGEASVSPLSQEAALHIPADQLVAVVFTNAQWLPIYGDVRINGNNANDPVRDDAPVGRYAFVVLNGCGYLDPNVVGSSNRLLGLTPYEIDIAGDGGRVLGMRGARQADRDFLDPREREWGHFATMRDFLRPSVTNALNYWPMNISGQNMSFPTNSFFVGSLALDDLSPPTGRDSNDYPIRLPKFCLRDDEGNPIDPADLIQDSGWLEEFRWAMESSFAATYQAQRNNQSGNLPQYFRDPINTSKRINYPLLAARNLLEMMDEDGNPGGPRSQGHELNSTDADQYVHSLSGLSWSWDRLPCVEPVPMLDNLVICGGYDPEFNTTKSGTQTYCLGWRPERERIPDPANPQNTIDGNVTGIVCTITLTLCASSDIYVGWNVPRDAEGTYTYKWHFSGVDPDPPADGYPPQFDTAMTDTLRFTPSDQEVTIDLARSGDGTPHSNRAPADFFRLPPIEFCVRVEPSVPDIVDSDLPNYIPDNFGFCLHAYGVMGRGGQGQYENNIVQRVPCKEGNPDQGDSVLDIYLPINRDDALTTAMEDYVLGATYAIDPRFAYKKMSWVWTPGLAENTSGLTGVPDYELRKSLVRNTLNSLEVLQDVNNPMMDKYLRDPRREISGKSLYRILEEDYSSQALEGGVSDVMRSSPKKDFYNISTSQANTAAGNGAFSVYFDPQEPDGSAWAFNRVGQLGFVPIGTHRTIALMDGFDNVDDTPHPEVRQRVLDFFTMHPPREEGSSGSNSNPGDPVRTALFTSRVGINPPRFPEVDNDNRVVPGDPNLLPLTAALNQCPLREWGNSPDAVDWGTAEDLAEVYAYSLDRDDQDVKNVDGLQNWEDEWNDAEGVTRSLSVLGRNWYDPDEEEWVSMDTILHKAFPSSCDFDREGVIRNTAEMLTTRQQLFTILLKADSFSPMSGFSDADHGMSLASVQAIAHIWRDPEPLRDADGRVILDDMDHPIHAWVLLDLYQF